jgi:hypothetical protein
MRMGRESVGKRAYDLCRRGRRRAWGGTSRRFRELRDFRGRRFWGIFRVDRRRDGDDDEMTRGGQLRLLGSGAERDRRMGSKWRPSQRVNS